MPFDDKNHLFCCDMVGFSIIFDFSDTSLLTLIRSIGNFPKVEEKDKRIVLKLGASVNKVSAEKLLELLESAHKRVEIVFTEHADLRSIFERDEKIMEDITMTQ